MSWQPIASTPRYWVSLLSVLCCTALVGGLSGCATEKPKPLPNPVTKPIKLNIVNDSDKVIHTVKFKHCGTSEQDFNALVENLKPKEKITMNIYGTCVDLAAVNAFDQLLDQKQNFQLSDDITWTVQVTK